MISINPIVNTKFKQLPPSLNYQSRPVSNEKIKKADFFERTNLSFKGVESKVNLHLPVEEIEKLLTDSYESIKKIPDVIQKADFIYKFIKEFYKLLPTEKPPGITGKQEPFRRDMVHEVHAPILRLQIDFANLVDNELLENLPISLSAKEYNNAFKQMCASTIEIIKIWEYLLIKGFDTNNINPKSTIKLALNSVKKEAKNRKVKIKVDGINLLDRYKKQVQSNIFNDYGLYNIFSNLIKNAVKYTQQGSIVNVIFKTQRTEYGDFLVLSIKDQGIGIPKAEQEKVLSGQRASNAIASRIEGTGYGLKRVAKILGNGNQLKINSPLNPSDKKYPGTEMTAYIRLQD